MSESKINFYLNDKQVEANHDETIWQVANRVGTEIPHLVIQTNLVTELMETVELVWLRLKVKEF